MHFTTSVKNKNKIKKNKAIIKIFASKTEFWLKNF